MKQVIREHLIDCSDPEKFVFNLICPECGTVWQSTPVAFSKAGEAPQPNPSGSSTICFTSGKSSGPAPRRWKRQSIFLIYVRCVSVWCAMTVSSFVRISICAFGVQNGYRKPENRFRLPVGQPMRIIAARKQAETLLRESNHLLANCEDAALGS